MKNNFIGIELVPNSNLTEKFDVFNKRKDVFIETTYYGTWKVHGKEKCLRNFLEDINYTLEDITILEE